MQQQQQQPEQDPQPRKRSHTIVHHASLPGDDDDLNLAAKDAQLRRWRSISDDRHYHHHHHRGLSSAISSPLSIYSPHGSPSPVGSPESPSSPSMTPPLHHSHHQYQHHHNHHFHHKQQVIPLPTIKSLSSLKTMAIQPLAERDASAPQLSDPVPSISISNENRRRDPPPPPHHHHHRPSISLSPSPSSISSEDQTPKGNDDNCNVTLKVSNEQQDDDPTASSIPSDNNNNRKPTKSSSSTFLAPLDIPSNTNNINQHRASRDSSRSTSYKSLNWVASNTSNNSANTNTGGGDLSSSLSRLASQAIANVHESINSNSTPAPSSQQQQQKVNGSSNSNATTPSNSSHLHKRRNTPAPTTTTPTSSIGISSATPLFTTTTLNGQNKAAGKLAQDEDEHPPNRCINPALYICQTIQEFADTVYNILPLGFANAEETLTKDMAVLNRDVDAVYRLQRELDKIIEELVEAGKTRNRSLHSVLDKVDNVKQRLDSSSATQRLSQAAAQMKEYESRLQKVRTTLGEWDHQDTLSSAASYQRRKEFILICVASAVVLILVFAATFIP